MDPLESKQSPSFHLLALPYPGRGHVNPMMNLCKLVCSRWPNISVTFVVTEEWHGLIGEDEESGSLQFRTIPNVIPSELGRARDFSGFVEAVSTQMTAPFEKLLDQIELPVNVIIADTHLVWVIGVGSRRNIPVASLFTMSANVFSILHHFQLLQENHSHSPIEFAGMAEERREELVDYIPGVSPIRAGEVARMFGGVVRNVLNIVVEAVSLASFKAQYLLFISPYKLEAQVFDNLKAKLTVPVYPVGPTIPYFELHENGDEGPDHMLSWLNSQPERSVLYVSMGSYLSVSSAQRDEITAGLSSSGVRFLWISRGEHKNLECSRTGVIVPWCDQLRVLCHPSIGGFWSHCGWNSTLEAMFAGVPVLACPIFWDQVLNAKCIVEDWKIGWRVKCNGGPGEHLVTQKEVAELVKRFVDPDNSEVKEMRRRAGQMKAMIRASVAQGGSSDACLDLFIGDVVADLQQRR